MKYLFILFYISIVLVESAQTKLSNSLIEYIGNHKNELIPVRIEFNNNVNTYLLNQQFNFNKTSSNERIKILIKKLRQQAFDSQKDILKILDQNYISESQYRNFWIVNMVVANLDIFTIDQISTINEIKIIDLETNRIIAHDPIIESINNNKQPNGVENGLIAINAPPLWALGYTGRGRMVYNYDTGVWPDHPAFNTRFIGEHYPMDQSWIGYFNPDPNGMVNDHGTHTLGTIAGLVEPTNDTIGIAFKAYWIANDFVTSTVQALPPIANMMAAFEWALNPDGDTATTIDVPDVINNSWRWYDDPDTLHCGGIVVDLMNTIEAAGIANVFSGGNAGPNNTTVSSPQRINTSEVNTFSVGSINGNLSFPYPLSYFSTLGPTQCPGTGSLLIHPEVVAPGHNVRSAWGNDSFNTISGTSMAAPHVSGAVLLLKEAFPYLTGEQLLWALYLTAVDLGVVGEDNTYGMGIIDVYAAFLYLSQTHSPVDPNNNLIDLSIDSVNMGNSMQFTCDHTFSPSIYISNKGDNNIDTIDFSVTINGSNVLTYNWVSSLNPGSSTMVNLPSFYIGESGDIEIRFAAEIRNNPLEYDIHNNGLMNRFNIRSQQEQPFVEHFENGFIDSLWFISNNDLAETWDTISTDGLIWNNFSASMQLFSYAPRDNQKDGLISPSILLSPSSTSHTLKFDLAYQQRSISSQLKDTLKVYLSDNCGSSFDYLLYHKYDQDLSTHDTISYDFIPTYSHHWRTDSIDLSNFSGQEVLVKFETTNRQGNNLYLDNIYIYQGEEQPVNINHLNEQLELFPNPANDRIYIETTNSISTEAYINIYNSLGQIVLRMNVNQKRTEIPLTSFNKGTYYLLLNDHENIYRKSFIIW